MDTAKKINYHGHYYHTQAVINMLLKEVEHFQSRIDMLSGSTLEGHMHLLQTYLKMVNVRKKIIDDLEQTLHK
ncbi:MAG: hypothetical protein H7A01_07815 [Hahellaceae bacterium]|jgi:hypothetical protein|nr:hypothetical protein [Hahellaceae bacterium]MCP5211627.1 hypothetical protein [Hahellaceae bacterium]